MTKTLSKVSPKKAKSKSISTLEHIHLLSNHVASRRAKELESQKEKERMKEKKRRWKESMAHLEFLFVYSRAILMRYEMEERAGVKAPWKNIITIKPTI